MPKGVYKHKKWTIERKKEHSLLAKKRKIGKWMKGRKGEASPAWKGNNIGYNGLHIWLATNFGRAYKCQIGNCVYPRTNKIGMILKKPKRYEWAKLTGKKYEKKRENFIMLCPSCHRKYDMGLKKLNCG